MRDLDIEQFWKDDEVSQKDNCFNPAAKQVAMGIRMSDECVFAELDVPGNPWGENPPALMRDYTRRYNDKAEKIVGRRLLSEDYPQAIARFPYIKRIGEIFGGRYFFHDGVEWLEGDTREPRELEKLLDGVEKLDIESFIFPDDWDARVKRLREESGLTPNPHVLGGRAVRGPTTLATSICGVENFLLLSYDEPELVKRFSVLLGDAVLRRGKAIDRVCGYDDANKPGGFRFSDDNCCLATPELYETFSYPILERVFAYFSPNDGDERYQHSDSPMAHQLPVLGRLNFTGVNFGPTVLLDEIRTYMPRARIDGCLDPMVFMRNERDTIVEQVKRDCRMAIASGKKGLNFFTAGSINNGSSLESMRLIMQAIQNYGRYDE
jgi:uroporphyrinogen decarboxylase